MIAGFGAPLKDPEPALDAGQTARLLNGPRRRETQQRGDVALSTEREYGHVR